jgi:hypothetical protein
MLKDRRMGLKDKGRRRKEKGKNEEFRRMLILTGRFNIQHLRNAERHGGSFWLQIS